LDTTTFKKPNNFGRICSEYIKKELKYFMNQEYTMHKAFTKFAEEKSQLAYEEFLIKFLVFAKERGNALVPADLNEQGQIIHALVHTSDGLYYVVCTHPDEFKKHPEKMSMVIYLEDLVTRMLDDDEAKGICVNPYSDYPCFIPKDYVKKIMKRAGNNKIH
jgi:hypothetical protein